MGKDGVWGDRTIFDHEDSFGNNGSEDWRVSERKKTTQRVLRVAEKSRVGCFEGTLGNCGKESAVRVKIVGSTNLKCWTAPDSWIDSCR